VAESGGHSHGGNEPDNHSEATGVASADIPDAAASAVTVVDAFGAALLAGDLGNCIEKWHCFPFRSRRGKQWIRSNRAILRELASLSDGN